MQTRRAPGAPIKAADDDYSRWLETCDTEITPADRDHALAVRQALRAADGTTTETYRRVAVTAAMQQLAGAGMAQSRA